MPKINLSLGHKYDTPSAMIEVEHREHFPSFHIESDKKLDLPHEGTMTIRFKKIGFSMREDSDGEETYSCDVEVHEIVDAYSSEPDAPARSHSNETGNALDELKAKRTKKSDAY